MSESRMSAGAFFRKYTMVIALVVVVIFFAIATGGGSLQPGSINNLISQNGYVFVLAAGMLCCILTGGNIDLSVGSVVCFTAAVGCVMMDKGVNMWLAVLAMLAIGLAIGAFQGFWIAKVRVPAFIATLSGMYAFRGFSNVVLQGYRVDISNEQFLFLFGGGRNCYIPNFIPSPEGLAEGTLNITALLLGVMFALLFLIFSIRKTMEQKEQGAVKSIDNDIIISLVVSVLVALLFYRSTSNAINDLIRAAAASNMTCLLVGVIIAALYLVLSVRKLIVQHSLGIQVSITADIIRTITLCALVLWLMAKLACFRGIPTVVIWIALVLGVYQYITTKTAMGRHLYAVGGNEKATALSGVKTRNVYWFAYASIGLMAGLAGILTAARAKGIDPTYGESYEMDAIASCFIGGASAYGGTGKVSGMIIGAVLMGVINQGMNMVGVNSNLQRVVKGLVLLVAVIFDVTSKRQKQ